MSVGAVEGHHVPAAVGSGRLRLVRSIVSIWRGRVGLALTTFVVLIAIVGPFLTLESPTETVAGPFENPSTEHPLGTDVLGRDALSRLLAGGRLILGVSIAAIFLANVVGVAIGMYAAYRRGWIDTALVGSVDILLSFPPIVLVLVLLAYVGPVTWLVVLGLAITQAPRVARVARAATLDLLGQEYVEAAVARGETTSSILRRELLPNISSPLLTDFGIRLTATIILAASISFLGLGPQPPTPDWGLMISENRSGLTLAPARVLAPALTIAVLTVGVNLLADAIARSTGRTLGDDVV